MTSKVGVGIIGTGFARNVQIPGFLACKGAEIVSVASGGVENAEATAKQFGIEHFTGDWRETVSHNDVELVCITTPPDLHHEMALFALEQGKHVLCEKPMAMSVAEAREMTEAAEGKQLLALIDHELRFQSGRQKAYQMLRDGAIGTVRHAKYNFRAPHRGDDSMPWNWWSDVKKGGGALGAIDSHIIDSFNWMLGTAIASVYCQLHTHVKQRKDSNGDMRAVTTDDEANMLLRFADGKLTSNATGLVSVSMVEYPEYVNRFEIFGTDGAMRIDHLGELYIAKAGETEWRQLDVDLGRAAEGAADTGFSRGFNEFAPRIIDAILSGSKTIEHAATFEDGLKVQQVLDAARESDSLGRVIAIH